MNIWSVVILGVIVILGFIVSRYYAKRRAIREERASTYDRAPNTTNYNMNMEESEIEKMSEQEAKVYKENLKKGDLSSLSHRDFYELKEKIDK
ncbi:MAG: hypothetical protein AAGI23_21180 [Bacteroidota bacterium]